MNAQPEITVLIATTNSEKYIRATIESVLLQSFDNFEIVIVANCISDDTVHIVESFSDSRIRLFETNICQIAFNLNYGLMVSRGNYIARIDSDDVAHRKRLEVQLDTIKRHGFDVVGSNIRCVDEDGVFICDKVYPEYNHDIRKKMLYSNSLAHPSIMLKKKVLLSVGGYLNGRVSEDYDLWIRLMRDDEIKFHNIQKRLTEYRVHSSQSMGSALAYAEVSGYFIREALHRRSLVFFFYFLVSVSKAILR